MPETLKVLWCRLNLEHHLQWHVVAISPVLSPDIPDIYFGSFWVYACPECKTVVDMKGFRGIPGECF